MIKATVQTNFLAIKLLHFYLLLFFAQDLIWIFEYVFFCLTLIAFQLIDNDINIKLKAKLLECGNPVISSLE